MSVDSQSGGHIISDATDVWALYSFSNFHFVTLSCSGYSQNWRPFVSRRSRRDKRVHDSPQTNCTYGFVCPFWRVHWDCFSSSWCTSTWQQKKHTQRHTIHRIHMIHREFLWPKHLEVSLHFLVFVATPSAHSKKHDVTPYFMCKLCLFFFPCRVLCNLWVPDRVGREPDVDASLRWVCDLVINK